MSVVKVRVNWVDKNRQPTGTPDPRYPNGRFLDMSLGARKTCTVDLEHPTKGCGYYTLECLRCHFRAVITTAGRADDPNSVKLACKVH